MSDSVTELTDQPPRRIAPIAQLSSRQLTAAFVAVSLLPLAGLSLYATLYGRAAEKPLPVEVTLGREVLEAAGGLGGILTDVISIRNLAPHEIPHLTINLNGQYFLYRDSPLNEGETLVLPQSIFMTKANQRFVPGRYPVTEVTVTGKLPSNARGVTEVHFDQ